MNFFKEKIRFPETGDKFFIDKGNKEEIAWLNKSFQEFGNYADSYQVSAINLIDSALSTPELKDYHIYPAVFLIRHYLELRLKELIQGLNYYAKQTKHDFPTHHDIQSLWTLFKEMYSSIGEEIIDPKFKVIDELIKEMIYVDPISMSFRYPVNKAGVKTQKLQYVNLSNLRETFIRVCFVFDGIAMQIVDYVDLKEDMLQDVYHDYLE